MPQCIRTYTFLLCVLYVHVFINAFPTKIQFKRFNPLSLATGSSAGTLFDDSTLSHIDYAIDKLNSRMKSEKAMSVVDANRFCVAIDAIIADAKTVHKQIKTGNNHTPTQSDKNNDPPKAWGRKKQKEPYGRPRGSLGVADSSVEAVLHPATRKEKLNIDMKAFTMADLGDGVPKTNPDLPATKELIAKGVKTQQRLGKIQTNTWGTSPFEGYDWGSSEEEDTEFESDGWD